MKGIVFTEFMEMVEENFGYTTLERIIRKANLPHQGLYVAGGTYPHGEIQQLVQALGGEVNLSAASILQKFGKYMFSKLSQLFPHFLVGKNTPLEFIASVDSIIHIEVTKLYPDAELPRFTVIQQFADQLIIDYTSHRHLEDFALGLMHGCGEHYRQPVDISQQQLAADGKSTIRFTLKLTSK